jgi:hypothetical protein
MFKNVSFFIFIFVILHAPSIIAQEILNKRLTNVQIELGETKPKYYIDKIDPILAQKGKEIFFQGQTTDEQGNTTPIQSKVFKCFHCHNTVIEDQNLNQIDHPEKRLKFIKDKNIAFLPGTTMYGLTNKTTWFNGDYEKKYGEPLIGPARKDLKNAIQLCSKECSKGRKLTEFEMKVMLHYLWSIEYKIKDLNLTKDELQKLQDSQVSKKEKLNLLDSKYAKLSNASFGKVPNDFDNGYGFNGDPEIGKIIFEKSCLHCHGLNNGVADIVKFRDKKITYKYLYRFSRTYEAPRNGIFSDEIYMPNYTNEKLSDKQLDDFKAFLKEKIEVE